MSVVLPIEEDPRFRIYTASDGQTEFAIKFPFQQNEDVTLAVRNETGAWQELSPTLYTITGAGAPDGGMVAFHTGRAGGEVILVLGLAILDRLGSVVRDGRFNSRLTDDELDRSRIIQQELRRDLDRAVLAPLGSAGVQFLATEPGQFLIRDANGNIIGADPPDGAGNMNTATYDPEHLGGNAFDARYWGEFRSRMAAEEMNIRPTIHSVALNGDVFEGDGLGGIFIDSDNGNSDTFTSADGRTWYRAPLVLTDGPKRMLREKRVITSDWQCVPEQAVQISAQRALMAEINQHHGDASAIDFPGDLVDRPTENTTGAAPGYGFPELLADLRTYLPRVTTDRVFFIPGNHERDGTGIGSWVGASSLVSYRKMIGPEFYYTRKGNFCRIYMGDMAGSVGGEIINFVIDWFKAVVRAHSLYNIIVFMHQPPDPTVFPGFDPNSSYYQKDPARITDVIAAADNIVAVFYGHVHSNTLASVTTVTIAYGTTWINEAAGIPTCYASGSPAFNLTYCVEFTEERSTDYLVRRWNSISHRWMTPGTYDVLRTLKYPAVLGGDTYDYDGRHQLDPYIPFSRGPGLTYVSAADLRGGAAPFSVPGTMQTVHTFAIGDDSNDAIAFGTGTGIAFAVPGQTTSTTSDGFNTTGIPGYGLGGRVGARRGVGASDQEDYQSYLSFEVRKSLASDHAMEEAAELRPSSAANSGLNLLGGSLRVGNSNANVDFNTVANLLTVQLRKEGFLNIGGVIAQAYMQRQGTDGDQIVFYRDTTITGRIQTVGGGQRYYLTPTVWIGAGAGSPEGSVAAPVGCEWNDTTNGVKYMKKTGAGHTGWKLVTQAA